MNVSQDYLTAGFLAMFYDEVIGWLLMAAPKVGGLRIGMRSYFGRYREKTRCRMRSAIDEETGPSLES